LVAGNIQNIRDLKSQTPQDVVVRTQKSTLRIPGEKSVQSDETVCDPEKSQSSLYSDLIPLFFLMTLCTFQKKDTFLIKFFLTGHKKSTPGNVDIGIENTRLKIRVDDKLTIIILSSFSVRENLKNSF